MDQRLETLSRWVDPGLTRSGHGGVVICALLGGGLADLAVRSGGGLSAAILVLAVAAFLLSANVTAGVCSRPPRPTTGWAAWNAATRAADDARRRVCPAR